MKVLYASLAFLVCVAISAGCSTAEKTDTHTGDSVANIVENKTTAEELVRMFGEPHVKTKTSRDEEKWVYTFITDKSKRRYSLDEESKHKVLNILLRNGVVVNYTFQAGKLPSSNRTE